MSYVNNAASATADFDLRILPTYLLQAQLDQNKMSTVEETKNPFVTQCMIFVNRVLLQRVISIVKALK